jgi:hypothetical protein
VPWLPAADRRGSTTASAAGTNSGMHAPGGTLSAPELAVGPAHHLPERAPGNAKRITPPNSTTACPAPGEKGLTPTVGHGAKSTRTPFLRRRVFPRCPAQARRGDRDPDPAARPRTGTRPPAPAASGSPRAANPHRPRHRSSRSPRTEEPEPGPGVHPSIRKPRACAVRIWPRAVPEMWSISLGSQGEAIRLQGGVVPANCRGEAQSGLTRLGPRAYCAATGPAADESSLVIAWPPCRPPTLVRSLSRRGSPCPTEPAGSAAVGDHAAGGGRWPCWAPARCSSR